MPITASQKFPPLRVLADVEAIEKTPLTARIQRWDFALSLLDACRINPKKPALIATNRGDLEASPITWSFDELESASIRLANLIHDKGLNQDDTVAIISPTVPAYFACLIGGMLAARPFPINWMLEPTAIADLLERSAVKMIISFGPCHDFVIHENVLKALELITTKPLFYTLQDPFSQPHENDLLQLASTYPADSLIFKRSIAQDGDIACFVHSGGTTGHPKVVKILHRGLMYRLWVASYGLAFTPNDIVLSDTPLFHIGGLLVRGLVSTANGQTTVLPSLHGARDKRYIKNYWRYIEHFGITQISGVPTTLSVLARTPPTQENISSLRPYFATGSAPIPPAIQQKIATITGAKALQSYGMTENTSHATLDPRNGEIRNGCSGFRVPYTQIRIVKMHTDGSIVRDCAPGEVGSILVAGPGVAGGYLNEEHNQGAFLDNGFFVTGDMGSLSQDGYLRVSGREKDLIIRGGHNIEPVEIEQALMATGLVAIAAAVGKPDAHAGELPIAFVELYPNCVSTENELLASISQYISERPAMPKEIIILDSLPLTSIGKPNKQLLRLKAVERVFSDLLLQLTCRWRLEVVETPGNSFQLNVYLQDNAHLENTKSLLSLYTIPYIIHIDLT